MNLFQLNATTYEVEFSPQALLIAEFAELWRCDPSEDKNMATKELGYIFYMADSRSTYMYLLDENERHDQICNDMAGMQNWIKPSYIPRCIEKYKELSQTTSTVLLESTRGVVEKISNFLSVIDPNERDKNTGKPVFAINTITRAVAEVPKLIKALNDIESEIIKEKALKAQSGNTSVGLFDDDGL